MTNEWVTLIPWFPLLQKVKNCYSHCYKQQLNKLILSTLKVAGLQNMAHQMGHGWYHTVFKA